MQLKASRWLTRVVWVSSIENELWWMGRRAAEREVVVVASGFQVSVVLVLNAAGWTSGFCIRVVFRTDSTEPNNREAAIVSESHSHTYSQPLSLSASH